MSAPVTVSSEKCTYPWQTIPLHNLVLTSRRSGVLDDIEVDINWIVVHIDVDVIHLIEQDVGLPFPREMLILEDCLDSQQSASTREAIRTCRDVEEYGIHLGGHREDSENQSTSDRC
jgi:hypothetical protein